MPENTFGKTYTESLTVIIFKCGTIISGTIIFKCGTIISGTIMFYIHLFGVNFYQQECLSITTSKQTYYYLWGKKRINFLGHFYDTFIGIFFFL